MSTDPRRGEGRAYLGVTADEGAKLVDTPTVAALADDIVGDGVHLGIPGARDGEQAAGNLVAAPPDEHRVGERRFDLVEGLA
jgi:hypothetical protein